MITSFAPNSTAASVLCALKYLILPHKWFAWKKGKNTALLEQKMAKILGVGDDNIISYDSGRTALFEGLKALGVQSEDEILLQAFTCVVVVNPIKYLGGKPIFVDVDENYNMDPRDLKRKITGKSKVLIIQHTFGVPADLDELLKIAKEHNLKVIEDCAHSLGATYRKKAVGTFADAAIFSFGVDKIISSVRGGALFVKDAKIAKKLRSEAIPELPAKIIFKHLMHLPVFALGKKFYGFLNLGKLLLFLSKKIGLTALIIENIEKKGGRPSFFPAKMPNALAEIALKQLGDLEEANNHRRAIASFYRQNLHEKFKQPEVNAHSESVFLRYPVRFKGPGKIKLAAKKSGILLGDWYDTVVAPRDIDTAKTGYHTGDCPFAEQLCKEVFNLPTHRGIGLKTAEKIVKLLNTFS